MRKFSVRPTLTLTGRTFKGLRGWSGKPLHPPLTDFPIVAYVLAAIFDVVSAIAGEDQAWARELWHAGTWLFVGGAAVSVLAALTGLWDWWKSSEAGTQARRTINTHATIMVTVTVLALVNIAWRLGAHDTAAATPAGIAILSVIIALLVSVGDLWRQPGLRLRLQRRDRRRPPRVAPVRNRRVPRTPPLTTGAKT